MLNSSSHLTNMDDECEIDLPVFVELESSNCIENELGMDSNLKVKITKIENEFKFIKN